MRQDPILNSYCPACGAYGMREDLDGSDDEYRLVCPKDRLFWKPKIDRLPTKVEMVVTFQRSDGIITAISGSRKTVMKKLVSKAEIEFSDGSCCSTVKADGMKVIIPDSKGTWWLRRKNVWYAIKHMWKTGHLEQRNIRFMDGRAEK